MLVLDNYGMSFSQLMHSNAFKTSKGDRKPIRQNLKGIQMFTSLWNWRAALSRFNKAVEKRVETLKAELLKGTTPATATETKPLDAYAKAKKQGNVKDMLLAKFN